VVIPKYLQVKKSGTTLKAIITLEFYQRLFKIRGIKGVSLAYFSRIIF